MISSSRSISHNLIILQERTMDLSMCAIAYDEKIHVVSLVRLSAFSTRMDVLFDRLSLSLRKHNMNNLLFLNIIPRSYSKINGMCQKNSFQEILLNSQLVLSIVPSGERRYFNISMLSLPSDNSILNEEFVK